MADGFAIASDGAQLIGERIETDGRHPLVLIHGFSGSRHDWAAVREALPASLSIVSYDQRGFGDSTGPDEVPFSHAEDLLNLLDALGLETVDICGMSLGGATALNFALSHPDRVRRLVLVSPLMVGWSWSEEWVALWKAMGRAARAGDFDQARSLWWQHPLFETTRDGPAGEMLRRSIDAFPGKQWVRDDQRPEAPDADRLATLSVPTLLLTGKLDMPDFLGIADRIGTEPSVTRIEYADAGHMLTFERPEQIAQDIAQFLSA